MSTDLLDDVRDGVCLTLAPLNINQYHQMIRDGILHDGEPIELIQGTLVYKDRRDKTGGIMTHGSRHLKTLNKLTAILSRWIADRSAFLQVQGPVTLNDQCEPEPDCSLIVGKPDDFGDAVPTASSVLVAFEVADSSLRTDRRTKMRLYADASIPTYVIVNLKDNLIEVHTNPSPAGSGYVTRTEYLPGDTLNIMVGTIGVMPLTVNDLI
ncbi:MAG: Uma2 family endonuclease [Planctomycetes bacterium]|nr:Uma2 family endonuclease [Planctomycetota bacterium]